MNKWFCFLVLFCAFVLAGCSDREGDARKILNETMLMVEQGGFDQDSIMRELTGIDDLPADEASSRVKALFAKREALLDEAIVNLNKIINEYKDTSVASEAIQMMAEFKGAKASFSVAFDQWQSMRVETTKTLVKSEVKNIKTGLEAYNYDYGKYPLSLKDLSEYVSIDRNPDKFEKIDIFLGMSSDGKDYVVAVAGRDLMFESAVNSKSTRLYYNDKPETSIVTVMNKKYADKYTTMKSIHLAVAEDVNSVIEKMASLPAY